MTAPYYDDGRVCIYLGDAEDVLPTIAGIDLVVTSPPFNLGVSPGGVFGHYKQGQSKGGGSKPKWAGTTRVGMAYDAHEDAMPYPEYRDWQHRVLQACWNSLSERGAIYYNHKPRVQASTLLLPLELNPGLPLRQVIIWARAGGTNFTPTSYMPTHEWIMVLARPAFRLRDRSASGVGDVWRIPQDTNNPHPAPFPVGLPERAIETTAPRAVLDPFMGSGTTLVAARAAGIKGIGIEISERYCEMAALRLSQDCLDFGAAT